MRAAGLQQCPAVICPFLIVEIRSEKPASLIFEHRINAGNKIFRPRITAAKVFLEDVCGNRDKCLMLACTAFHLWLATYFFDPFVRACGRIAGTPSFLVLPANRINIWSPREEIAEQSDLLSRR